MKAVILAGGMGTRLSEETATRPKPMVEIGGKPILWHIMKIYSAHGVNDFIVCLGYKGYMIKEYFANYFLHTSDVTFDIAGNSMEVHHNSAEPWRVTLVDTGDRSMTGGRLLRVRKYVENESAFCFTYGDGVTDLNIAQLIDFHRHHDAAVTVTGTQAPGRFGALATDGDVLTAFVEKPVGDGNWVSGGFFVLSPRVFDYLEDDFTVWEQEPLGKLAAANEVRVFRHPGFWQPMDTLRDKIYLESLWETGKAPWKVW